MDNQDILRKHVEAFSTGDWNTLKSLFTDDVVYEEEPTRQVAKGADKATKLIQPWKKAFPDGKGTIKNTVATGDAVVAELEWEGTQSGELVGPMGRLPASGKRAKVSAVLVARFENGKIREMRHYFDLMTLLAQLGVSPRPAAPAAP